MTRAKTDLATLLDLRVETILAAVVARTGGDQARLGAVLKTLIARLRGDTAPAQAVETGEREALHDAVLGEVERAALHVSAHELRVLSSWRSEVSPMFGLLGRMATLAEAKTETELLAALARAATPSIADLCMVDTVVDGHEGRFERAHIAHDNPRLAERVRGLCKAPAGPACSEVGMQRVLRGESQMLANLSHCDDRLGKMRDALDARSMLIVPLRVASQTIAVVSFVTTLSSGRQYGRAELALAEELVHRVALLIENRRLHEQRGRRELKTRLALTMSNVKLFEVDQQLNKSWLTEPMPALPDSELATLFAAKLRDAFSTGEITRVEGNILMEGKPRTWVVTLYPIRDDEGNVLELLGAAVDVTDEKRAQGELSAALEFRDEVLGILGHDLRNPLSAILGIIGLARLDPALPAHAEGKITQIEHATRRMLEMINTLLDFSETRFAHELPMTKTTTDLRDVAAGVIAEFRSAHPQRTIELEAGSEMSGMWDRSRLAQVVSNLIGNAVTHGHREQPIRVSLRDAGTHLELDVHNHGPVITEALHATIFEPFRRGVVEPTPTRGLGLGLFIARQIVQAHGGTITCKSSEHEGTTFSVRLPRGASAANERAA